ncbi:MAG: AlpA family phage regulatory protein [Hyphomicrobiaceae bacterium]|nr:AlpA family phage regulatory protein [Hyphomicrobiaceae bacterium]
MSELLEIVPFSRQHILRLEKRGRFPRRIRLGENRVAWLRSEVEQWIEARVEERDER